MLLVEHLFCYANSVCIHDVECRSSRRYSFPMTSKNQRLDGILEMVGSHHFMSIGDLAKSFAVSEMTIRRDVRDLVDAGKVRAVYGGVASLENSGATANYNAQTERTQHADEKRRIALAASTLLSPGDVAILDSGTTVQQLAECLPAEGAFTFICYSLNTMNVLARREDTTVISLGGVLSPKSYTFSGPDAVQALHKYRANKVFIGATGYELKHGLTCSYVEDCSWKQAAMQSSVERILLVDSSKFGKVSTCSFAGVENFDTVVTDDGIPEPYRRDLEEKGLKLLIA
ncbi:DeoR/GlpR transcriptional regulator [Trinickia terrae]|uniref:DeoR/GlpR transcriptional regulator n=1 Tax=Trinickia terrae TaxID=2571161 RepID=A0A4U1I0Y7_9BURK|nr:DeoR/GlpR family DNA-binding transcription regulator [Trinickia terrae]TKC86797.1 DeoR/GlpR transcriptional regulator [Trinickia terrae]